TPFGNQDARLLVVDSEQADPQPGGACPLRQDVGFRFRPGQCQRYFATQRRFEAGGGDDAPGPGDRWNLRSDLSTCGQGARDAAIAIDSQPQPDFRTFTRGRVTGVVPGAV